MPILHTPAFWYTDLQQRPALRARLLSPAAQLYGTGVRISTALAPLPVRVPLKTVCIGNLCAGGSGKTPAARAVMDLLRGTAAHPVFLTRGYGRKTSAAGLRLKLDHGKTPENWRTYGDEACLLARDADVYIDANRVRGAQAARHDGADLVVMDDGFQNPALHKDLSLLVAPADRPFGNGRLLPAGPLREPVPDGLARADAAIVTRNTKEDLMPDLSAFGSTRLFTARLEPDFSAIEKRKQKERENAGSWFAFCGLGRPERFYETLKNAGLELSGQKSFPDHYTYTAKDIADLTARANRTGARLITTEKDAVRLAGLPETDHIETLPVRLVFDDPAALSGFIQNVLDI